MQRIALLLSMAAVGGCVSQPVSLSKSAVKAYDVFLGQPVVADTVFRDGDRLNFQLVDKRGRTPLFQVQGGER